MSIRDDRYGLSVDPRTEQRTDSAAMEVHLRQAAMHEFKVALDNGVPPPPANGRHLEETGRADSAEAHYLVWVNGKMAGTGGYFPDGCLNKPGEGYVYVFPEHRGHGLGRYLARWLIGQGMDVNIQDYSLGGLRSTNSVLDQIFGILDAGRAVDEPTRAALALVRRTEVCSACDTSVPLDELHEGLSG